jgi:iron(III) transport system permease protein
LFFVFTLLAIERWSRGQRGFAHTTGRYRPLPRFRLTGWRALGAAIGCALPVTLGFLFPAAMLVDWALRNPEYWLHARFAQLAANSFAVAGMACVLAVFAAIGLAYARRMSPDAATSASVRVATAGYAVPGAVLAIGVLAPLAAADHWIATAVKSATGLDLGLVLTGTLGALMFAYLVRFLTVSFNVVESSLGKITRSMDDAARSLGRQPAQALADVHFPIMRGSILMSAILVFVEVLKELPATLVLRPFNFDTLATKTYDLAADERLAEAAGPALAIGLVGIVPVALLARTIRKSRPGQDGAP